MPRLTAHYVFFLLHSLLFFGMFIGKVYKWRHTQSEFLSQKTERFSANDNNDTNIALSRNQRNFNKQICVIRDVKLISIVCAHQLRWLCQHFRLITLQPQTWEFQAEVAGLHNVTNWAAEVRSETTQISTSKHYVRVPYKHFIWRHWPCY